jgi:putative peptidoglycan lipid II flippase
LGGAAALLIGASLFGQILGFLRTKLVNANFPALGPHSTDAYFAAFKIPDFFFFTLAAGALGVAFIPFIAERLNVGDKKGIWQLTSSLLNLLAVVTAIVGVIIFVFARPLLKIFHLEPEQTDDAVTIMRLIAFNPFLFTLSGILISVQQSMGRFFFYAIAPLFYNACIIGSAILFSVVPPHQGGPWNLGLVGLGVGALVGAVLQLLVVCLGLYGTGFRWRPKIAWKSKDFRQVLRQLPARSIDQGIDSINSMAEAGFSTRLGQGKLSFYENAYILHTVPIQLIGTTIATAAFPRLTDRMAQGRTDLFRQDFLHILRAMIWIIMPIIVVCYFCRGYLARLIFTRDANEIGIIFGYLTVAILFRVIYSIISRWFYAQKDTKTPLFVSLFIIALNIVLAYTLSRPTSYGVAGLAMAQSIVAVVEVFVLAVIMLIRDHKLFDFEFWSGILRIFSVTGFSVLTAFIFISFLPLGAADRGIVTLGTKLLVIVIATFTVHVAISLLFGLEEAKPVIRRVKQFILRPVKVT